MHAPKVDTLKAELARALRLTADVSPWAVGVLFVLVMGLVAIPVSTHPLPPLSDYFNNLARAYVITAIGSDPDLQRFYAIEWQVVPNLMIDLVVPVLHRFMTIYLAGQVFIVTAFFLMLSGTMALNRALFGRWSAVPLVAAVLIYNEVLLVGVVNYVFGIGLSLWAPTAWIALRERAWPWRFAVSTLFALALFACHLFAVGLYGLGLLAFESQRLWATRKEPLRPRLLDFVATGLPFVPVAALLLASPTMDLAGQTFWEPWGKFEGLQLVVTVYYLSIGFGIAVLMIAAIALAARLRLLRLHPVGWALLAVGLAVYVAMPRAIFGSHLADERLPVALAFMLIACLDLDMREWRVRYAFAVFLAGLLALRLAEVQIAWNGLARELAAFRQSVMALERGARILVVHADRDAYWDERWRVSDLQFMHAASLATIERSALVSTTFSVKGKQILHVRKPYRKSVDANDGHPPQAAWLRDAEARAAKYGAAHWTRWQQDFDYVYVLFAKRSDPNPDERRLALAAAGPGFKLYRVIKPR
ncbi:MAG: hypothetical protein ACRECO_20975 [Xanthobacteraceae bacterium]